MWCFLQYAPPLHNELHLICRIVCAFCHAMPCIIKSDIHHTWLCIMPCPCVVCLLCCVLLLDSSCFVAIVRIRSSTLGSSSWLHLLHGLVLLPSGISGKMIVTLDLTTSFAMLGVSMLSLCCATYHLFIKPPRFPCQTSNPPLS